MYQNDEGETAMTHEEMLEEAARRELINEALEERTLS